MLTSVSFYNDLPAGTSVELSNVNAMAVDCERDGRRRAGDIDIATQNYVVQVPAADLHSSGLIYDPIQPPFLGPITDLAIEGRATCSSPIRPTTAWWRSRPRRDRRSLSTPWSTERA